MQEAWKTATLCSTKGLLTQKAGESKEKDRNGKINWHPSTTAAGIQQKWGKFHFRGIHRGARNGTTTTAFRNKQWQKKKGKKKDKTGHSHIHKTLTHSIWLSSLTSSFKMGEYGEHECATLIRLKKIGWRKSISRFWHMQHMKCEWKAPPEQKSKEKKVLGQLCWTWRAVGKSTRGETSWTIVGCNHGDIKIMPRSKHSAVNDYAPSHPFPDDAGIALDTRHQLPQLRKEQRTTPAHEKRPTLYMLLLAFFSSVLQKDHPF